MSEHLRDDHIRAMTACLADHFAAPVEISDLNYLYGGASRILARFTARIGGTERRLVFRLDPPTSFVDSDRAVEFSALEMLHGGPVPVPEPVLIDTSRQRLPAPFFVMGEIPGGTAAGFFDIDPYGTRSQEVGVQLFTILGQLAKIDPAGSSLPGGEGNPASIQLDRWERIIDEDEVAPQPIARSAIRALRRRLPAPPPRPSIVHGDFRSGNFLIDAGGRIIALLDWEFVHLGDPLEDIAWCADPLWTHGNPDRIGGMLPLSDALGAFEAASGMAVDPARLDWWRLFTAVKGIAMWTSAASEFLAPGISNPSDAFADATCLPVSERTIAETLARWEQLT